MSPKIYRSFGRQFISAVFHLNLFYLINGLAERKLSVRIAQTSMNASRTTGTGLAKALVAISKVATSAVARISLGTN